MAVLQEGMLLAHADGPFANDIILRAVHEYVAAVRGAAGAPAPSLEDLRRFSARELADVGPPACAHPHSMLGVEGDHSVALPVVCILWHSTRLPVMREPDGRWGCTGILG